MSYDQTSLLDCHVFIFITFVSFIFFVLTRSSILMFVYLFKVNCVSSKATDIICIESTITVYVIHKMHSDLKGNFFFNGINKKNAR